MKKYNICIVEEIINRFNDKSINIMIFSSHFESIRYLINKEDAEIITFCGKHPIFNDETVVADF